MADVKISALPAITTVAGTDVYPTVQGGVTYKATVNQLFTAPVQQSYEDFTAISDPSAPSSGFLRIYSKNVAGRIMPKWIGPSGVDSQFQAGLNGNSVTMWLPGTGTTLAINFGTVWATTATQATPAIANTNVMTSIKRATYTTTTTASNTSGVRSGAAVAIASTVSEVGGYFFAARWGILTYVSTMRCYVGLSATTTALAGDPSAQNNTVAMSKDTGETTWQWMSRDATSAEKTSSGHTTAAGGSSDVFDFFAFCAPGTLSPVTGRIVDVATSTVYVDNVAHSTHVPVNGSLLYAHAEVQNVAGGAGTACAIFLSKIYVECDN